MRSYSVAALVLTIKPRQTNIQCYQVIQLRSVSIQSLFLTKRKELWLSARGRFSMRSGMPQGIVVMREWEDI